MDRERVPAGMPPAWPYYQLPCEYRDVRFQQLFFQADPAAVAPLVPAPLEPVASGLCASVAIDVPFASSYGSFQEWFLEVECQFRGGRGFYVPLVCLNNVRAICAGREIYGTPKVWAEVSLEADGEALLGRARLEEALLVEQRTVTNQRARPEELPATFPAYRLKLIPSADGRGAAVRQLVTASPSETELRDLRRGSGEVRFGQAGGIDLRGLRPRQLLDAFTFRLSYEEGWGEIVYDELAELRTR